MEAGKQATIVKELGEGAGLDWRWKTAAKDVSFSVTFQPGNSDSVPTEVHAAERLTKHTGR